MSDLTKKNQFYQVKEMIGLIKKYTAENLLINMKTQI